MKERLKKGVSRLELGLLLLLGLFDSGLQIGNRVMRVGVANEGVSFGMFKGVSVVLLAVVWLILLGVEIAGYMKKNKWNLSFLLMIIGGWVNLLMRVWFGSAWDYIRIPMVGLWINISDMMITSGMVMYILKK